MEREHFLNAAFDVPCAIRKKHQPVLQQRAVDSIIGSVNASRDEKIPSAAEEQDMESSPLECVYVSIDDVGVKHQKSSRSQKMEKDAKHVENTVVAVKPVHFKYLLRCLFQLGGYLFPDTLHTVGKGAQLYGLTGITVLKKIEHFCRIPVTELCAEPAGQFHITGTADPFLWPQGLRHIIHETDGDSAQFGLYSCLSFPVPESAVFFKVPFRISSAASAPIRFLAFSTAFLVFLIDS